MGVYFFSPAPDNRDRGDVDRVAFLAAATKQAGQHVADRPPAPPISRMQGSSKKMFLSSFT